MRIEPSADLKHFSADENEQPSAFAKSLATLGFSVRISI
jgi:hypothetical protein